MNTATLSSPRAVTIYVWILRLVVAAMFIAAATMKLTSQPMMVAEFEQVGLGQWFRIFTGILELVGGIAVLVPRVSVIGAGLLLLVDAGAFVAQVGILHMDWIHTIIIGAIIALLIQLQRRTAR